MKNTKPKVLQHELGPYVRTEGLVFHGTAGAIPIINNISYAKNEHILKIQR